MLWLSSYGFCLNMLLTKVISLRCYPHRGYSSCTYYTLTITIYHWCSSSLQHLWVWCYPLNWHRDWIGVVLNLFQQFKVQDVQWFSPTINGYATLATSLTLVTSWHVPAAWKLNMAVLGATVALCLICSISAAPLDPLSLHFFTHGCNIHAIHPTLLTDWHLTFKQVVSDWINLGPNGDPGPFQSHSASYHNLQVCYYSI